MITHWFNFISGVFALGVAIFVFDSWWTRYKVQKFQPAKTLIIWAGINLLMAIVNLHIAFS